ncbi:MAG TPA: helix-turn-helix domain-containing protein [Ktedonobacterales bacterium]|nr:helix-turn-helix domain-containing protein [Ktedonobacterales bacterium]
MATTSRNSSGNGPGKRIRDFRIARNMTQKELANGKYSVSHISAVERGKVKRPSQGVLEWCAQRLGVSVLELLGEAALTSPDALWVRHQWSRRAYEQIYAQMLIMGGDIEEGLARVRALRRDPSAPADRALVWFSAYGSALVGELDEATQEAEAYRRLVEETHDAPGIAAYHWLRGQIALANEDFAQAHIEFLRALDAVPEGLGDPDAAQTIRRTLTTVLRNLQKPEGAYQVETDALRDYEHLAEPGESSRLLRERADRAANGGNYENAYRLIRRAWNSQRGTSRHRDAAGLFLRHATYVGEDLPSERREAELRRAALLAELTGDTETRLLAGAYLAQFLARRGALGAAEEVMRLAAPGASADRRAPIDGERGIVLGLAHGWMAAAGGQEETARRLAEAVDAALEALPDFARTSVESAGFSLSRLFERLGDEARAFHALKRATSQHG